MPQVGAGRGDDGRKELAQDAVVVQAGHRGQAGFDRLAQQLLRGVAVARRLRIETRDEQVNQALRNCRVAVQRVFDISLAEGKTELPEIPRVGAQQHDGPRIEPGAEHEAVQIVTLHFAAPGLDEQRLEALPDAPVIRSNRDLQAQVVDPQLFAANAIRVFIQHARAHAFEHRQ